MYQVAAQLDSDSYSERGRSLSRIVEQAHSTITRR
jgi:hypothetical protein